MRLTPSAKSARSPLSLRAGEDSGVISDTKEVAQYRQTGEVTLIALPRMTQFAYHHRNAHHSASHRMPPGRSPTFASNAGRGVKAFRGTQEVIFAYHAQRPVAHYAFFAMTVGCRHVVAAQVCRRAVRLMMWPI